MKIILTSQFIRGIDQNQFTEIAIGFKYSLQATSESLTSLSAVFQFKLKNAAVILAFISSLVLHIVLFVSRSTQGIGI